MKLITLRPFEDGDINLFKQWVYQDYVAKWYEHPLDWIDELEKRNAEFHWIHHYIVMHQETPIGFCQYYEYHNSGEDWHGDIPLEGTYSIDYMIGNPDYLRKGYGTKIILALIDKVNQQSNAKRIIVQPESDNKPSCHTLLSAGFTYDVKNKLYLYTESCICCIDI